MKVLICDDDMDMIEMTTIILKKDNFEVESLSRMNHLITKAETFNPDIILMDISMPNISGTEAVSMLRSNEKTANMPVVLFSANPRLATIAEEYETDFIHKPFNIDELRSLLRSYDKSEKKPA